MKLKLDLETARGLAGKIAARLAEGCHRIEIAGSIRRRMSAVGDIELVAIPRFGPVAGSSLWSEHGSHLDPIIQQKVDEGKLERVKNGPKYKQFLVHGVVAGRKQPLQLDLFLARAEGWGYQFAIRTGPGGKGGFSQRVVTNVCRGGLLADGFKCDDGRVWCSLDVIDVTGEAWRYQSQERRIIDEHEYALHPVPEERDFFKLIRGGYVEPWKRR